MSVKSPGIRYRCSSNTGSNHLMIEAIRSATSCHVSQYLVDESINNVALAPSSSLSRAFTFQYVACNGLLCACHTANDLTGHSFSCKTALNCGSSHPGRRPLQALRLDVSFLLMLFSCTNLRFYPRRKFRTAIAQYTIARSMLWIMLSARKVQLYPLLSPISYLVYPYNHVLAIQSNTSSSQMSVTSPISPPSG
jgi:hypothetical protein